MDNDIRKASAEDIPAIVRLNREVQALHANWRPAFYKAPGEEPEVARYFADHMADDEGEFAIYERDGDALGYIWIAVQDRPETPFTHASRRVLVNQLTVAEVARERGVGSALLEWAQMRARVLAADAIVLDHLVENGQAARFYRHRGYDDLRLVRMKLL